MREVHFLATMDSCQNALWMMKYVLDLRGKLVRFTGFEEDEGTHPEVILNARCSWGNHGFAQR